MYHSIQQIGDSMPGGFFVYRANDTQELLYVNKVTLDIFGCKTYNEFKELTGFTFPGLVYPEDRENVLGSISRQVSGDEHHFDYVEYRIVRKDGEIRWVDDYGRLVSTEEYGDVYYVIIRDNTQIHMEREESLRSAKVIEGLSAEYSSIYLVDLKDGTTRSYRRDSGFLKDVVREYYNNDSVGTDWRQVLHTYGEHYVIEEDRKTFLNEISTQRIKERLSKEDSYSVDYRLRDKENCLHYFQMSIVAGENPSPDTHVIMGFRDITEHTIALQKNIAEKLYMESALEKEKQANEVRTSFLFNVSHDIRTPMNAIKGFTDLAVRHLDERDKLKDYLGKVQESNTYMLTLIDDLLEISRLNFGTPEMRYEECDLREPLASEVDNFRKKAQEKGLSLTEEIALPEQEVYIDKAHFRRIISNVLQNAITFTPFGGQILVKALQKESSDSGYVRYEISVSDTGIGMSEDFMKRMYEVFEREKNSTQSGTMGTGLGLSIVKRMLDVMGGTISVESKIGQGSTFTIGLPLKLVEKGREADQDELAVEIERGKSGKRRILLVEDIEINRLLAENILQEYGFLVESVADGSDAVEVIESSPECYFDLILMDIQMPVMNGYEATRKIRAMGRKDTSKLPIIALSANAREEDRQESLKSGMNNHVAKPFDIDQLIRTINEYIG